MLWRKKAERAGHRVLRCSFCNKYKDAVPKLIAGPNVFICSECVAVCNDILADDARFERQTASKAAAPKSEAPKAWPNALECALCREPLAGKDGVTVGDNRGIVCADCVSAVRAATGASHNAPAPPP